jgi:hypothetical protein
VPCESRYCVALIALQLGCECRAVSLSCVVIVVVVTIVTIVVAVIIAQVHVQKRFEESGPNRHHLLGRAIHVEVVRGLLAPEAVLDNLVTGAAGHSDADPSESPEVAPRSAAVPTPLQLNAPPPPRVRRPTSSRTASASEVPASHTVAPPPLPSIAETAAAATMVAPAPLENVTVRAVMTHLPAACCTCRGGTCT